MTAEIESDGRRSHMYFAVLGFVVAAGITCYQVLQDSLPMGTPNWPLLGVTVLICPPSLLGLFLAVPLFEAAETGTPIFYALWFVIAVLNAVLYFGIGTRFLCSEKVRTKS